MSNWNESDLISQMTRLGCFHAKTENSATCRKFFSMVKSSNKSNEDYHSLATNDDYSVLQSIGIVNYSFAMFFNLILLYMLYKDPLKRLRNASSLLIANLAISDLLGSCFSLAIEREIRKKNYNALYSTTYLLPWLVVTTAQCSYLTVMLVSCERYAAIAHPFRYRTQVNVKHTIIVTAACWMLAFLISTPFFFVPKVVKITTGNEVFALNTFILTLIILVLYPMTYASLRRQRRQLLTMNSTNLRLREKKLKIEQNFANTMLLVCLFLVLFTSPYVAAFLFTFTKCNSCLLNHHFQNIWLYYRICYAVHFGINPVLYVWRLPSYRKSLFSLLPRNRIKNRQKLVNQRRPRPRTTLQETSTKQSYV